MKRFNSLPKSLMDFFDQMKNGCEGFPKFTEISDDLSVKGQKLCIVREKLSMPSLLVTVMVLRHVWPNFSHLHPYNYTNNTLKNQELLHS